MLLSPQDISLNNKKEALLQMVSCQKSENFKVQGQIVCCRTKEEETGPMSPGDNVPPTYIRGILRATLQSLKKCTMSNGL